MNDITIRFLDTYEYLKKENIVYTPKGFANEINVSTSLITEICKKRTNAGITPIQNLIARFTDIDANWLLTGQGSMLKSSIVPGVVVQDHINYKDLADARLETIEGLKFKVSTLEKELVTLKKASKDPILYKNVAEPAPELITEKHK